MDARFAEGYPQAEFSADGRDLTVRVKLDEASPEAPVPVYIVVNQMNSHIDTNVAGVLHGHAGEESHAVQADAAPLLWVTDTQEQIVTVPGIEADSTRDVKIHFVVGSDADSQSLTTLVYNAELSAEVDQAAPTSRGIYRNKAGDKLYLYYYGKLDEASVPAASAFAVKDGAGGTVAVTGVEVQASERNQDISRVVLTLEAGKEAALVSYTPPEEAPLQDTAAVPNRCEAFADRPADRSAAISTPTAYLSADGAYLHIVMDHSINIPFGPADSGDATVTVTYNGQPVTYRDEIDWDYSNSGGEMNFYFRAEAPVDPVDGGTFTVTLNVPEGAVDFADDPIQPLACAVDAADTPLTLEAAELTDTGLRITVAGEMERYGSQAGCIFLLTAGGEEYRLRGTMARDNSAAEGTVIFLVSREQIPLFAIPAGEMTLRYDDQVHAGDTRATLTELSGKPMAGQSVQVNDARSGS